MTIDPRIPTVPGRSTSDFHQPGRWGGGGIEEEGQRENGEESERGGSQRDKGRGRVHAVDAVVPYR